MKEINELIVTIAKKKAEAAREAAEAIIVNEIEFKEGIQPGEVELRSGIEELCALMIAGGKLQEDYYERGTGFVSRVRRFVFEDVCFFEEYLLRTEELPEGANVAESREALYASV